SLPCSGRTPMRPLLSLVLLALFPSLLCAAGLPIYLWHEPEWFDGVDGSFAYWTGTAKPAGKWGIAGPGISPEWTQGGESASNSIGVPADETKAEGHRGLVIPRATTGRGGGPHRGPPQKKGPVQCGP